MTARNRYERKEITMKKRLIFVFAIIAMIFVGINVRADEITLDNQKFDIVLDDVLYVLHFERGPFGPGEIGKVTLSSNDVEIVKLNYEFNYPFCLIDSELNFVLLNKSLIYLPEDTLIFTKE